MHDFINEIGLSTFKCPKLKGHVKIELKNVETGKKEVVFEGDNMITNALSDIFASNYSGALDYRKFLPLYSKMLGGVLLFGNVQDISSEGAADDYFIPDSSSNPVIAHAGQTTYTSQADDMTRGNPLDSAMHVADGAVTLAWTWGASAGNGTIKSVSLTHADVGDAGTGSNSDAFKAMIPVMNATFGNLTYTRRVDRVNNVMFVGADGYGYNFYGGGGSLTFVKFPLVYEKSGLVYPVPFSIEFADVQTISISTNYNKVYAPLYFYDKTTDYLWLFHSQTAGTHIDCEKIKISTLTATHIDITTDVTTGPFYNDGRDDAYGSSGSQMPYYNGSVYLGVATGTGTTQLYRIKLSSLADQSRLDGSVQPFGGVFRPNKANCVLVGRKFVINNGVAYPTSANSDDKWQASTYHVGVNLYPFLDDKVGLASLGGQVDDVAANGHYYVAVSKFYLASKFNLPTPVTKANNQSMTVTYTLTEV